MQCGCSSKNNPILIHQSPVWSVLILWFDHDIYTLLLYLMSGCLAWRPAMMRTQVLDIIPTATNTINTTIGAGVFNNKYVSRPLDINDFYTRVNILHPRLMNPPSARISPDNGAITRRNVISCHAVMEMFVRIPREEVTRLAKAVAIWLQSAQQFLSALDTDSSHRSASLVLSCTQRMPPRLWHFLGAATLP